MNRGPFRLLSGALSESGYPPEPVMGFNPGDSELILSKISVKMYLCHDLAVSFVHYTFKSCILYLLLPVCMWPNNYEGTVKM